MIWDERRNRKKIRPQKEIAKNALKDVQVKIAKWEYLEIYEEKKTPFKLFAEKYLKMIAPNVSPPIFERLEGIVNNHRQPWDEAVNATWWTSPLSGDIWRKTRAKELKI